MNLKFSITLEIKNPASKKLSLKVTPPKRDGKGGITLPEQ